MELSERFIQKLEKEGFTNVYEWQDPAGTVYQEHSHAGEVSVMVTDGSITFDIQGKKKEIVAGQRLNIPPATPHSAIVGPAGWIVIVGEEIDGDS